MAQRVKRSAVNLTEFVDLRDDVLAAANAGRLEAWKAQHPLTNTALYWLYRFIPRGAVLTCVHVAQETRNDGPYMHWHVFIAYLGGDDKPGAIVDLGDHLLGIGLFDPSKHGHSVIAGPSLYSDGIAERIQQFLYPHARPGDGLEARRVL